MFTGNKDTDFLILIELNDKDLLSISRVNKYIYNLCKDEIFWRNRIIKRMAYSKTLISFRKHKKKNSDVFKDEFHKSETKNLKDDVLKEVSYFKKYFGINSFRCLNSYLNKFVEIVPYLLFRKILREIEFDKYYKIDEEKFVDFVNYDELIYYLRREYYKNYFCKRNDSEVDIPRINVPGFQSDIYINKFNLSLREYNSMKFYGIRGP